MHYLHVKDLFHSDWIKSVHETLDKLGFSNIWSTHNTFYSQASFKNKTKTRLADQLKQEWQNKVNETERCLNYRLYKKILILRIILTFCHCLKPNIYVNLDVLVTNCQLKKDDFRILKEMSKFAIYAIRMN